MGCCWTVIAVNMEELVSQFPQVQQDISVGRRIAESRNLPLVVEYYSRWNSRYSIDRNNIGICSHENWYATFHLLESLHTSLLITNTENNKAR